MRTIATNIDVINPFFNILKSELGGTMSSNQKEHFLNFDNASGKGKITSLNLEDGISVIELSVTLSEDTTIEVESETSKYVNFIYCSKGKLSHSFNGSSKLNSIETFQTSIISNISSSKNTIVLEKDVETIATIISVNTAFDDVNPSVWTQGMKDLFIANRKTDYLYVGSYNLKITESIKQLRSIKQEGLVRGLLTKGIVNVILALEIEHHNNDMANMELSNITLTRTEIEAIEKLSDYINEFPDLDHKVENLCSRSFLSAVKLQDGFKFKHGLTICEYIRQVRLTKSEELMSTTDMNISEIVYSVGFTSRSYFSKIFKERFDCTPSEYKKNKLAVSA